MALLFSCLAAHALLSGSLPSPWWVPNLTLIGLVRSIGRTPRRWMSYAMVAGVITTAWAIRDATAGLLAYAIVGWLTWSLSRRWDITDRRVQCLLAGFASAVLACGSLWCDALSSLAVWRSALLHILVTTSAAWLVAILSGSSASARQ